MSASQTALVLAAVLGTAPADGPEATGPMVADPRDYTAIRTVDQIVIDGRADEETWKLAPKDDRFVERQPELGAVPPDHTTVQVAYDDTALYVFIDAKSATGEPVVRTLRRDNFGIFNDDTVYVKIDPTFTRRDAYSLGVNAEGVQIDALGLDDGAQFLTEWDGVWRAETVRRDDGFTAEFAIPFAILGIKSAEERTIGFNVTRDVPARNATYDWRLLVPPRSPMAASQFGEVKGLRNIEAQRAIEYTPYALLRTNFEPEVTFDPARRPNFATGGDLRVQIGAGSYAEASLLTDFAQVEADEVQVARDRFPLFFPERRPFFINGLEIFDFGRPGEAQLFFSRRVGLVRGIPVALLGGAKVYGRAGPVQYGALQVQTLGAPDDPERGIARAAPQNVSVGRIRVQATRSLNVGMILLGQHRFGETNADNAAGGFDAQVISRDGRFQYDGFIASTWAQRPGIQEEVVHDEVVAPGRPPSADIGPSAYSTFRYQGLFVRPSLLWLWSDDDFQPELGFYRRPGATRQEARVDFAPRPNVLGLREIIFGPAYSIETTPRYDTRLGQSANASVRLNWRNGSELGYEVGHFVDDVQDPFVLYLHTVEAQRYTGFRHRAFAGTPERRSFRLDGSYELIELFGGLAHQPSAGFVARLGKHLTVAGRYTHLLGHLADPDETFNFGFANGNVDVAITRNLALDNLLRLDLSPNSERVGVQTRLRWRFAPGSDLFVVYRTDQPVGLDPIGLPDRVPFHELTIKLSYYLRAFVG